MFSYQRYLRERKEVYDEVEEGKKRSGQRPAKGVKKTPPRTEPTVTPPRAEPTVTPTRTEPTVTPPRAEPTVTPTDKPADGEKKPSLKDKIFRGADSPLDSTSTAPEIDDSPSPMSVPKTPMSRPRPVSLDRIGGDTISEILLSAGANPSTFTDVIKAVRNALLRAELDIKDKSFLR